MIHALIYGMLALMAIGFWCCLIGAVLRLVPLIWASVEWFGKLVLLGGIALTLFVLVMRWISP